MQGRSLGKLWAAVGGTFDGHGDGSGWFPNVNLKSAVPNIDQVLKYDAPRKDVIDVNCYGICGNRRASMLKMACDSPGKVLN